MIIQCKSLCFYKTMCLLLSQMVYLEKSEKISLSHGRDVRMLGQEMRKYINDLLVNLQQFGIITHPSEGKIVVVLVLFGFGLAWRR